MNVDDRRSSWVEVWCEDPRQQSTSTQWRKDLNM